MVTARLPHVAFSVDSATWVESASALAKCMINGELDDEAFANPVQTHLNFANVISGILQGTTGGGVLASMDAQGEQVLLSLQSALGINVETAGGSGVIRQLILQKLIELSLKFAQEWFERRLP